MTSVPIDVLELLREQYPFDVPAPRADLAARINAGLVGVIRDGDELAERRDRRRARALPVISRGARARTVAAALVAAMALIVGLGAAGALPAALQRPVASAFAHLGIDFPTPANTHHGSEPTATTLSGAGTPTIGTSGSSDTSSTATPTATGSGSNGSDAAPSTTAPGSLPPIPDVTVPSVTVPSPTLPPVTVPEATLPPVTAPTSAGVPTLPDLGSTAPPPPLPPLPVAL